MTIMRGNSESREHVWNFYADLYWNPGMHTIIPLAQAAYFAWRVCLINDVLATVFFIFMQIQILFHKKNYFHYSIHPTDV